MAGGSIRQVTSGSKKPLRMISKKAGLNKTEKKQVRSILTAAAEKKHHKVVDSHFLDYLGIVGPTNQIQPLCEVPQDTDLVDDVQHREGETINPSFLKVRMYLTSSVDAELCRIVLFRWRTDTGSDPPLVAGLFQSSEITVTGINNAQYMFTKVDRAKFNVLYDKTFFMDNLQNSLQQIQVNIPLKGKMKFNKGTAVTGGNQIFMVAFSNKAALGNRPILTYSSELYFTDL